MQWIGAASTLRLAWTVIGLVAAMVTTNVLGEALGDYAALKRDETYTKNGPRHLVAIGHIRRLITLFFICVLFTALGLGALFLGPPAPNPKPSASTIIATVCLVGSEILVMFSALFDKHDQRRLAQYGEIARARDRDLEARQALDEDPP